MDTRFCANAVFYASNAETSTETLITLCTKSEFALRLKCREQYGIPVLVKLLEAMPFDSVTAAAADALRALAMSNEANKSAIREAWAVPLLVKLLGSDVCLSLCACLPACHVPNSPPFCLSVRGLPACLSACPTALSVCLSRLCLPIGLSACGLARLPYCLPGRSSFCPSYLCFGLSVWQSDCWSA